MALLLALALLAQDPPALEFPDPGLDEPAAYEGYTTRLYRDGRGNTVQIYLDRRSGRVVAVWADAANESLGFTARDTAGQPVSLEWAERWARMSATGPRRSLAYRLRAPPTPLRIGQFILGSMRVERDFQYSGGKPYVPTELEALIASLEQLPAAERARHLALLGARDAVELRARLTPRLTVTQTDTNWVVRVEQPSFDGKNHLTLTLRADARRASVAASRGFVEIRPSGAGPIEFGVEITTDAPQLTPLTRDAIFNDAFRRFAQAAGADTAHSLRGRRLERAVRGFELLSSREKLMAGLPNFATYFGRDMLITALLMEPVWSDTMAEHVIAATLRKLAPSGEVSHEEAVGGQAIREHAADYVRLVAADSVARARALLANLQAVRENYMMVDDDFQLAVVAARYFADPAVSNARKRRLIETWRDHLLRNLAFVARSAAPYARNPAATNLVGFRRLDDGWWHAGSWRDSRVGYAGGRFAMDVNVVWVPAALRAIGVIDSTIRSLGFAGVPEAPDAARAAEAWRGVARHFEVALAPAELRARVNGKLGSLPTDERVHWAAVLARSGFPADTLRFLALSLDAEGRPIPVMSTDPAMLLLLQDLPPAREAEILQPFTLPYPVGLLVEGLGPLAANDAYAPPAVWEMFERDLYHSPRVVWGREVNVLLAGLARRLAARPDSTAAAVLERTLDAVERSSLRHAELWSYRIAQDGLRPVRYGTSSDVQLWNLTDLAIQFLLSRLPVR